MNRSYWSLIRPHLFAILAFLIAAVLYCHPTLSGEVLQQGDLMQWKGMAQDAFNYKAIHGQFPLWNTHLFSGMPNYQIAMDGHNLIFDFNKLMTLWLPKPISFFFLASICFYILTQSLRLKPIVGVLGSLAFAFATYNPVIIAAGHESKTMAICYLPALLAGLLLLFDKRYAIGMFVTTFFASLEIGANHPQISYYFLICIAALVIYNIIVGIKSKQFKHTIVAISLAVLAGLIGLANMAMGIFPTYEYAKYTIRGGSSLDISSTGIKQEKKSTGLDENYAFQYSLGKAEALTVAMPNAFGGSSGNTFDENSAVYGNVMNLGQQLNGKLPPQQLNYILSSLVSKYWGGVSPFTSGPVYAGTLIVLFAIIGWVIETDKRKWWILAALAVTIFMAWGIYFESFNLFLFKYLPLYNKFRAPSMAMVIPQLLLPLMAAIGMQNLFYNKAEQTFCQKHLKTILYALAGFVGLLLLVYLGNDYSFNNKELKAFLSQPQINASSIMHAIESARKSMFLAGIGRVMLFSLIILISIYAYIKKALKPTLILCLLLIINMIDLIKVDSQYLGASNYVQTDEASSSVFARTSADDAILKDTSAHYRVFNLTTGDPFTDAMTSYYHRSIGGYHAAKLSIYQNMIAAHLTGKINEGILNMLDTRYIIAPGEQKGQLAVQKNSGALGPVWFVKHIQPLNSEAEELKAIGDFNPKDTVFVQKNAISNSSKSIIYDSAANIKLTKYFNDQISYSSSSSSPQFAVFSEIYYPAGWNAYIDGKKSNYVKADYVLRGMIVPSGKHEIEFKFEPTVVRISQEIVYVGNILFWLSIGFCVFFIIKDGRNRLA